MLEHNIDWQLQNIFAYINQRFWMNLYIYVRFHCQIFFERKEKIEISEMTTVA